MTPREADVAFVLESVAGVRAVFALDHDRRAEFDFAIEVEGGGALAEAHYALLRVLTHDECGRVYMMRTALPRAITDHARRLSLNAIEREQARRRVPPPQPRPPLIVKGDQREVRVLIVGTSTTTAARIVELLAPRTNVRVSRAELPDTAAFGPHDLVICDARCAFGKVGLLQRLPQQRTARVLVVAGEGWALDDAIARAGGALGVVEEADTKALHDRILDALGIDETPAARSAPPTPPRRRVPAPVRTDAFNVLLVDIDADIHESLRQAFPGDARHVERANVAATVDLAFSEPFHLILCSGNAATHPKSFLDALAREDATAAESILILTPARDVPYVRRSLATKGRNNTILALPLDDASLQRELHRRHPSITERVAISEHAKTKPAPLSKKSYRRLATLIVDDDRATQILFSAGAFDGDSDVSLATTPMEAFTHLTTRPIDVLVVSAAMRTEGGEPIYRTLWRLSPELKSRSFLLLAPDQMPPSTSRAIARPLDRKRIELLIETAHAW